MSKLKLRLIAYSLIAFVTTTLAAPTDIHNQLKSILTQYLKQYGQEEHISAAALTISRGPGKMFSVYAGTSEYPNQGKPVDQANLYQIGSITKSFTSVILLQLAAEGKLSLDDTVGKYYPQYQQWSRVSLRQLLNMTGGLPNYSELPLFSIPEGNNIQTQFTAAGLVEQSYGKPMTTGYAYSNTGYLLAGMIASKVSGKSFPDLMRELISQNNLTNTFYAETVYPRTVTGRMVSGYYYNVTDPNLNRLILSESDPNCRAGTASTDIKCSNMSWAGAAGGIVSDTQDVTRWARLLFTARHKNAQGKVVGLLPAKQLRELKQIVATDTGKRIAKTSAQHPQGFGLGVVQSYRKGLGNFWYYQGETLGYRVMYAYFPDKFNSSNGKGLIITIALNSQPVPCINHNGELMMKIHHALKQ